MRYATNDSANQLTTHRDARNSYVVARADTSYNGDSRMRAPRVVYCISYGLACNRAATCRPDFQPFLPVAAEPSMPLTEGKEAPVEFRLLLYAS